MDNLDTLAMLKATLNFACMLYTQCMALCNNNCCLVVICYKEA